MPAIDTMKGIAPGKIFYHVYGSVIAKGKHIKENPEDHIEKIIVTSFPKNWHHVTKRRSESLFFDVLRESSWGGKDWYSAFSVRDCGINTHKYNLNRIFATKVEALEFVSECLCGKFFDKEDQEVYDRSQVEDDAWFSGNF